MASRPGGGRGDGGDRVRICLDFDGVIHDAAHPVPGRLMGPPVEGALAAVNYLIDQGHTLVVHTARIREGDNGTHVVQWLAYWKFPEIPVALRKPYADVYVDDKGLRFGNWDIAIIQLRNLEVESVNQQLAPQRRSRPGIGGRNRRPGAGFPRP